MKRHFRIGALAIIALCTPLAVGAQDLARTVEQLSARLSALEKQNTQLRSEVQALKKTAPKSNAAAPAATAKASTSGARDFGKLLDEKSNAINLDRPMTSAPAFTALDVSPETISHPETPRDFAAGLLNGVDRDGRLQTGLAVEVTPLRYFMGGVPLERYEGSRIVRGLYNTSLSVATSKAAEKSDEVRVALGLQTTLLDTQEDKIITALRAKAEEIHNAVGGFPTIPKGATEEQINRIYAEYQARHGDPNALYLEARSAILSAHYSGFKLTAAWAPVWLSDTGKTSDLSGDGSTAWLTGSWQWHSESTLVNQFELLGHLRHRQGEHVTDPADAKHKDEQDTLLAGAGLRFGSDNWHALVEASYLRISGGFGGDGDGYRVGGGFERRITENLWFVMQAGHDFGAGANKEDLYALGSFRFGTADSPIYTRKAFSSATP